MTRLMDDAVELDTNHDAVSLIQDGGVITHNMKDALTALGCAQDAVDSTASELKALTGELDLARQALARHSVAAAEAHTHTHGEWSFRATFTGACRGAHVRAC